MKKFASIIGIGTLFLTGCVSTKSQIKPEKLEVTEDKKARALALFKEGAAFLNEGDYEQAVVKFTEAAAHDGGLYAAFYNRGLAFEALGKLKEAEQSYESCLAIDKTKSACLENILIVKVKQQNHDGARELVRGYLAEFPEEPFAHVAAAQLAFLENDFSAAQQHARTAIEREAENVEALFIMAKLFFAQKEYAAAKWVVKNALETAPSHGGLHLLLGHIYVELDQLHDALDSYRLAVKFQPTEEALESFGLMLLKRGLVQESVGIFERLTKLYSKEYRHFLHLGNATMADKQFKKSHEAYLRAMELNPNDKDLNFNLGLLYFDLKPENVTELERLKASQSYFKTYLESPDLSKERVKEVNDYLKTLEQKIELEEYAIQSAAEQAAEQAKESGAKEVPEDSHKEGVPAEPIEPAGEVPTIQPQELPKIEEKHEKVPKGKPESPREKLDDLGEEIFDE